MKAIITRESLNPGEAAKPRMLKPYSAAGTQHRRARGRLSPAEAIRVALHNALPWRSEHPRPLAPTFKRSRANTGRIVMKGTRNKAEFMATMRPVRTISLCQLNFHPSMMLRPEEVPGGRPLTSPEPAERGGNCIWRVQRVARSKKTACMP